MKKRLSLLLLSSVVAGAAFAAPFTADFETNQSANFTVVIASSDNDANANFTYNSSTHVQADGDPVVIPAAPSGVSTNNVLRLNTNLVSTTDVDAVVVYPNTTGIGANWAMNFDCWHNHNGNANGGTGSTNFLLFGATSANTIGVKAESAPSYAGDGFYFTTTVDGGALQDYRFYSGTGTIQRNDTAVSWLGGAAGTNLNNLDDVWDDPTTGFFPSPPFQTAGVPDKQWITIRLEVVSNVATVFMKRPGDASFINVGTAPVPATATNMFIAFSDLNTGLASPVSDQFVLVDNLVIGDVVSSVETWSLY